MKRKNFTESQIVTALKRQEGGVAVKDIARELGISEATFYNWKAKYGGMEASDVLVEDWQGNAIKKYIHRKGEIFTVDLSSDERNQMASSSSLVCDTYDVYECNTVTTSSGASSTDCHYYDSQTVCYSVEIDEPGGSDGGSGGGSGGDGGGGGSGDGNTCESEPVGTGPITPCEYPDVDGKRYVGFSAQVTIYDEPDVAGSPAHILRFGAQKEIEDGLISRVFGYWVRFVNPTVWYEDNGRAVRRDSKAMGETGFAYPIPGFNVSVTWTYYIQSYYTYTPYATPRTTQYLRKSKLAITPFTEFPE